VGNYKNIIHRKRMKFFALILSPFFIISVALLIFFKNGDDKIPETTFVMKDTTKNQNNNMDVFSPVSKFKNLKEDFVKLHFDAVTVDSHNDFLYNAYDKGYILGIRNKESQSDIPKFFEGGLDVQIFSLWIPMKEVKRSYQFVVNEIKLLKDFESENSGKFEVACNYGDIKRIVTEKKICGMMGIEGGTAVGKDLNNVKTLFDMGVRYISLTWNNSNAIGTSAMDEYNKTTAGGLTEFGFEVIKKMDETGMLIDVSHLGEKSFWDVIKTSKNPIIASHSDCYSINPHYRNLTDDQIKAIAASGGVIMINFHNDFTTKGSKGKTKTLYDLYSSELDSLSDLYSNDPAKVFMEKQKFLRGKIVEGGISSDIILEHIDYIKNLVGVDFIGIGSDLDGGIDTPYDLYDVTCYPLLTQKMVERGYTEIEIRKILGLNFLRVFKQVCG
jgi:membrane dipeptidase